MYRPDDPKQFHRSTLSKLLKQTCPPKMDWFPPLIPLTGKRIVRIWRSFVYLLEFSFDIIHFSYRLETIGALHNSMLGRFPKLLPLNREVVEYDFDRACGQFCLSQLQSNLYGYYVTHAVVVYVV